MSLSDAPPTPPTPTGAPVGASPGATPGTTGPGTSDNATNNVVSDSTTARFADDVLQASAATPVVVDFWAPWCAPCRQLTPLLERLIRDTNGGVRMVKINIDDHPDLARQMQIQSIPAVVAFHNGRPVDGFMGALPESQLRQFIDRLMESAGAAPGSGDGDVSALIAAGDAAMSAGNWAGAAQAYGEVLQRRPETPDAIAGLAQCHLAAGDPGKARQILALTPPDAANHERIRQAEAALGLAEKTSASAAPDALAEAVARSPDDHATRFDLALALHGAGHSREAVDHLLTIVEKDPAWNEQAARKQLLELFEAFGPAHDLTIEGRQRLSSLLFR